MKAERPALARLESLPERPGVYLFRDSAGAIVYVGKAKSLRARVRNYFHAAGDGRLVSRFLERRVHDVEWIVTDTEKEALLLENNLIKEERPRYNLRLKDDKSFLSIRIDAKAAFPRLQLVRRPRRDGALYFGPYASAKAVRDALSLLHGILPLRDCKDAEFRNRTRPCIKHQIGRCSAPCVGLVSEADYRGYVERAAEILRGRRAEVVERLRAEMARAAEALEFERAARMRDQIAALEATLERQKVEDLRGGDRDILGIHREGRILEVGCLFLRGGTLLSFESHSFETDLPDSDVLGSFLGQFYGGTRAIPDEVLLPLEVDGRATFAQWLADRRGRPVEILVPERGEKARLVALAAENARSAFQAKLRKSDRTTNVLLSLQQRLGLLVPPRRIDCFDVSNLGAEVAVASLVVFEDGEPARERFRHFRIRTVEGTDDFAMLREALGRRYAKAAAEGAVPDLVMVDGGAGQLAAAVAALAGLGLGTVDAIGLAKERVTAGEGGPRGRRGPASARGRLPERIYTASAEEPYVFSPDSAEIRLLARIRDEAHRFAIRYVRAWKRRKERTSILEEVPGLGPRRAKALLERFGGLRGLRAAGIEDLRAIPGIDGPIAERLRAFLHDLGRRRDRPTD